MLPPSMFGDNGGEYEGDNRDVFEGLDIGDVQEAIGDWSSGSGFSTDQWMEGITDIRDVWYDENGTMHGTFDFDIETDEGDYVGTRSF